MSWVKRGRATERRWRQFGLGLASASVLSTLSEVRLAVDLGTGKHRGVKLAEWTPETELRRSPLRVKVDGCDHDSVIVPDGAFVLEQPDGARQRFFVEMDMGTLVSPARMKSRMAAYLALGPREHPTPVLLVVPSRERQATLSKWALEQAREQGADPTIFWITRKDLVSEDTILSSSIWQVVGGPGYLALLPGVAEVAPSPTAEILGRVVFNGGVI